MEPHLLFARVRDEVTDSIVGWRGDCTDARLGCRPWLIFGAARFGLPFIPLSSVLLLPPVGLCACNLVVWLLIDACYTIINAPCTAQTPDLTRDYDERTSLNATATGAPAAAA